MQQAIAPMRQLILATTLLGCIMQCALRGRMCVINVV
jgi:hypothetical protein